MFSNHFSHYLTYGATDQHTIIELSSVFDGLVVPATVAAFQRDGTGGFVLTLSAREPNPDYVIDPRLPLFQQGLESPKKSHEALAQLLGDPALVSERDPRPRDFDDDRITTIAGNWISFNLGYTNVTSKFAKYAKRLNEEIVPEDAKAPQYVIAPYFMAEATDDPWWDVSERFFASTRDQLAGRAECIRTIALKSPDALREAFDAVDDSRVAIWINDLHELTSDARTLAAYLRGVQYAEAARTSAFALYGGFFSVLAGNVGLAGSCHGIGFGEHRSWIELPRSGPAPARYYVPLIHRYVSQEDAFALWRADEETFQCECRECAGKNPIQLEYHELMKHSVYCRDLEINEWIGMSAGDMKNRLESEHEQFQTALDFASIPERIRDRLMRLGSHMPTWIDAVGTLL